MRCVTAFRGAIRALDYEAEPPMALIVIAEMVIPRCYGLYIINLLCLFSRYYFDVTSLPKNESLPIPTVATTPYIYSS